MACRDKTSGFTKSLLNHYKEINRENARKFTWEADFVLVHDPQPAWLINEMRSQAKHWIWRCHIDVSRPNLKVWKFLREIVSQYDASIFSMAQFAQNLPHPQYLIRPSIDPLSEKNRELTPEEIQEVLDRLEIERDKPIILQVSRFDSFKDPVGVIQAFRMVRKHTPCKLVLAGGEATDDPEGPQILAEVMEAAQGEPDIQVLLLPAGRPSRNQRPAARRGYHRPEIHPGRVWPDGHRGHVERQAGHRRRRGGHRPAAPGL